MSTYSAENDRWLTFGLAFVGGYGDAAAFLLAGTFAGHVTGNLVLVAISFAQHDARSVLRQFAAIVTFLCGVLLSALLARLFRNWTTQRLLSMILALEVLLIATAAIAIASHLAYREALFLVCLALALGLQNGSFRRAGGTSVHTTYMTGMITNLITSKAAGASRPVGASEMSVNSGVLAGIWAAFVLGAGVGATAILHDPNRGIVGAAVILILLAVRLAVSGSRPRTI